MWRAAARPPVSATGGSGWAVLVHDNLGSARRAHRECERGWHSGCRASHVPQPVGSARGL